MASTLTVPASPSSSRSLMTASARRARAAGASPSKVAWNTMMLRLATLSSAGSAVATTPCSMAWLPRLTNMTASTNTPATIRLSMGPSA